VGAGGRAGPNAHVRGGGRVGSAGPGRRAQTAERAGAYAGITSKVRDWNQWSRYGSGKVALADRPGA
jgi:hypothetical protein